MDFTVENLVRFLRRAARDVWDGHADDDTSALIVGAVYQDLADRIEKEFC